MFIANELIKMTASGTDTMLVDTFDWYIAPSINPDGYEYTWTTDRLWRKTQSLHPMTMIGNPEESRLALLAVRCMGTDPNRNFDFQWGGLGTSKDPCSQVYKGPYAASEPEVKAVQDFVYDRTENIKLFLSFHSYSQMILLPWGYDSIRVDDYDKMMAVGKKAATALQSQSVHGTTYEVGASPDILYPAAGGAEDYAKAVAGIKFAYCFELRDTGSHGFLLPADQIIPTGQETFAAVRSMAEDVIDYYQ